MKRRLLLLQLAAIAALPVVAGTAPEVFAAVATRRRSRPGTVGWPNAAAWAGLRSQVGGRLLKIASPFAACSSPDACAALFKNLKNPYYINETPNVTQSLGWANAWKTEPSVYAVAAESSADVAAAVKFARKHDLRVAVRGGAHSYQGTSNAPDSLLIWTRAMDEIVVHDAFAPRGCSTPAVPAVTVGAGVIWMHAYDAVTTKRGRYVQGGGCATVGVAGLISSGGFGSFSKRYGMAAGGLLEAEIVTADGIVRVANACENADLFWALKGGGGGTFGVITRLTLMTHALPANFGALIGTVTAKSDAAFRRLVARFVDHYADALHNEHWGEQTAFRGKNQLDFTMISQGLDADGIRAQWKPFFDFVAASPDEFVWTTGPNAFAVPAQHWWDPAFIKAHYAWAIAADTRPGAKPGDVWWAGNTGEAGQYLYEYESLWMPASLLAASGRAALADALFAASRKWDVSFHFNKGLNGAPADAIARSRETATNPTALDAFALAIVAATTDGVYPGVPGHEPDVAEAAASIRGVRAAMGELRAIVPNGGSYVSEASYFDRDWQRQYWGPNYARLKRVKAKYDPDGLFIVHNGVGSEGWSRDGFTFERGR